MSYVFDGNILEYHELLKETIHNYNQQFQNAWLGADKLKLRKTNERKYHINTFAQTIKTPERRK